MHMLWHTSLQAPTWLTFIVMWYIYQDVSVPAALKDFFFKFMYKAFGVVWSQCEWHVSDDATSQEVLTKKAVLQLLIPEDGQVMTSASR